MVLGCVCVVCVLVVLHVFSVCWVCDTGAPICVTNAWVHSCLHCEFPFFDCTEDNNPLEFTNWLWFRLRFLSLKIRSCTKRMAKKHRTNLLEVCVSSFEFCLHMLSRITWPMHLPRLALCVSVQNSCFFLGHFLALISVLILVTDSWVTFSLRREFFVKVHKTYFLKCLESCLNFCQTCCH